MLSGKSFYTERESEDPSITLDLANTPDEPTDGKYTITKLWDDLGSFIEKHEKTSLITASSDADEKTYALCKSTMEDLYRIGREAEKMHYIKECRKKARHGMKAKNLFTERFGKERIPPVEGIKSAAYVNDVILPFIERSSDVMHEKWLKILCRIVRIDLDREAVEAKISAKKCKELISIHFPAKQNETESLVTTLKMVGHFAVITDENKQAVADVEEIVTITQQKSM